MSIGEVLVMWTTYMDSNTVQLLISTVNGLWGVNFVNMKSRHVPNRCRERTHRETTGDVVTAPWTFIITENEWLANEQTVKKRRNAADNWRSDMWCTRRHFDFVGWMGSDARDVNSVCTKVQMNWTSIGWERLVASDSWEVQREKFLLLTVGSFFPKYLLLFRSLRLFS